MLIPPRPLPKHSLPSLPLLEYSWCWLSQNVYAIEDNYYLQEFIQRTTVWPSDPTPSASVLLQYVVMLPFCFGLLYCRSEKDFLEVITFRSDSTRRCLNCPVQKACHAVSDTGPTLPVQEKIPSANPNSLANQWEMIYRMTNSASSPRRAQAVSNVTTFSTLPNPHSSYQRGGKLLTFLS